MTNQVGNPYRHQTIADLAPVSGPGMEDLLVGGAAIGAFLTVVFVGMAYVKRNKLSDRIKSLQTRRSELRSQLLAPKKRFKNARRQDLIRDIVTKLNLLQDKKSKEISGLLVSAGYRSKDAPVIFAFAKFAGMIVGFLIGMAYVGLDFQRLRSAGTWELAVPLFGAIAGLYLPGIMVTNRRIKRYDAIRKGLADGLDLLLICAEAGLTLSAALDKVSKELGRAYPELAEELMLTAIEIGFLPERRMALENLGKRVDIDEIRGLVGVLVQTEKYGTPIAKALRTLSKDFRTQRMLRAEQKAARLPAIMTIPIILFILPTMFIVVIAPAAIGIMDTW